MKKLNIALTLVALLACTQRAAYGMDVPANQPTATASEASKVLLREMIANIPVLNPIMPTIRNQEPSAAFDRRYYEISNYFRDHGATLQSISALIQEGTAQPGSVHANLIRNRKIGDYLYEIARANNHTATMDWLIKQKLADPRSRFFQRMFQMSLNRRDFQAADAELWLQLGAQVDAQDGIGITALMRRASMEGSDGIAQMDFLIKHGADVNLQNSNGDTALNLALQVPDKVKVLLDNGARTDIINKKRQTVQDIYQNLSLTYREALQRAGITQRLGIKDTDAK